MSVNPLPPVAVNARYITFPIFVDPQDLMQLAFNYLKTQIPGWEPSEGQLDVWLIEAVAGEAADIGSLASEVPKTIFRYFGSTIMGIQPVDATSATCSATFYFTDDTMAHSVLAGTQVGILDPTGNLIAFEVLVQADAPGGVDHADVTLIASLPGANGSGLGSVGGNIELIDILDWVDHVTQNTVTSGGQDAELDDDYLSRLTLELQTMSPRPILPIDFSILARNVDGVQRATTLDTYNPLDDTYGNERMVTVVAIDENGQPVSSQVKANLQAYLDAMREVNFVVNTMDANLREIDVAAQVTVMSGYNSGDVANRVEQGILNYLNPAAWGRAPDDDPGNPQIWTNDTKVRYLELATIVNNVAGVGYVVNLTLGAHGGTLAAQDYTMLGAAPLPFSNANDITVTTA